MARAAEYQQRYRQSQHRISSQVETASQHEVATNRRTLTAIVDTLKLAAAQNISLRGHSYVGRIDTNSILAEDNDGNFRTLLRFRMQSGTPPRKASGQCCR